MFKKLRFIPVAFTSIRARKLRSFLSILGIVCGVLAVMVMISTGEGAKQEVLNELDSLGLSNIYIQSPLITEAQEKAFQKQHSYGLSWNDIHRLRKQEYIKTVAAVKKKKLQVYDLDTLLVPQVFQIDSNYQFIKGLSLLEGRFLSQNDSLNNNKVCVIGSEIAKSLRRGTNIGNHLRIGNQLFKIVGVLEKSSAKTSKSKDISRDDIDEIVFIPFSVTTLNNQVNGSPGKDSQLNQIIAHIEEDIDVLEAAKAIKRVLKISHDGVDDYKVIVPLELLNNALQTQAIFNLILAVVGGISLFVGGIGIMNIMLANVSERKREIGIRRAVGATQNDIRNQFLTESIILTLVGGLIGVGFGFLAVILIEQVAGWPIKITLTTMLSPLLLALCAGLFFGIYPATQAAKLEPIETLKSL